MANREIPIQELLNIGQQWRTTCDIAAYLMNYKYESLEKTLEKYNYFYKELKPQYVNYQNKLDSKISELNSFIQKLTGRINQLEIDEENISQQVPPGSTEEIFNNINRLNQTKQKQLNKLDKLNNMFDKLSLMIDTLNGYERIFINRLNFIEPIEKFKKLIEDTKKENPEIKDITEILFIIYKNKPLKLLPQDRKTYLVTTKPYEIKNNFLYIDIFTIIQKIRGDSEDSEESKGDVEERDSKDEEPIRVSAEEDIKRRFLEKVTESINKNTKKYYIISLIKILLNLNFITNETDLKNIIKTYYIKKYITLTFNIGALNEKINKFYEFVIKNYNNDKKEYFDLGIHTGKHIDSINESSLINHYKRIYNDEKLFNFYIGISHGISLNMLTEFYNQLYNIDNGFINKTDVDEECKEYVISKDPPTLDSIVTPDFGRDIGPIRSPSIASYNLPNPYALRDLGSVESNERYSDYVSISESESESKIGNPSTLPVGEDALGESDTESDTERHRGNSSTLPVGEDALGESYTESDTESDRGNPHYKKYLKYKNKYLLLRSKSN
jgi:hypothetical protein